MTIVIIICLAVIGTWVWVEGPKRAARKALTPLAAVAATVLVLIASWHVIEPRLVHLAEQARTAVTPDLPDVPEVDVGNVLDKLKMKARR